MIGVSIYLSKERVEKQEAWVKLAKENGFSSIFTSLHIPEDDPNTYQELIQILGKQALENEMELMVDVSPKSLNHLGITYENVKNYWSGALLVYEWTTALRQKKLHAYLIR